MKEKISITLDKSIIKNIDSFVDRIFVRNRSQAIEKVLKLYLDKNKTAVILYYGPQEKIDVGKGYVCEAKINGKTLIERQIRRLKQNDFRDIYIVGKKEILESIFSIVKDGKALGVHVKYIEKENAKGSADALRAVKKEISNSFLVIFGDVIFDKINLDSLWENHIRNSPVSTLSLFSYNHPIRKKGEAIIEGNSIVNFKQKPPKRQSYIVFSPVFVCEPELLYYRGDDLEKHIFPALSKKGLLNGHINQNEDFHIHNKTDLIKANKIFK